jgi:DNA-binding response OmpR family regulator
LEQANTLRVVSILGHFIEKPPMLGPSCLAGLRVAIVEDEALLCLLIEDILVEAGATVLGIAKTVPEALELIERTRPHGVTLNGKLGGTVSGAVAERLEELGIRYLVVSGEHTLPHPLLSAAPRVSKPFTPDSLKAAVHQHFC